MRLDRRHFIAAGCASAVVPSRAIAEPASPAHTRLGMVIHSFAVRSAASSEGSAAFADPLNFLEYCRKMGAGGIQVPIGRRDRDYTTKLRTAAKSAGMFVEGSIRLPRDKADAERFAVEVRSARECGVRVLRTVALSGRRYEVFESRAAFDDFAKRTHQSLIAAEPIIAREKMQLAVENHKDWRIDEHLDLIRRLSSEHVGICVDTGNNIALLEDPYAVIEAYAKWALTIHLKDMAVAEYEQGFLLSEVPLGTGFLDLPRMIAAIRRARPEVKFNLEMITRDPLRIPCLTDKYWATFPNVPGRDLTRTLALVRRHAARQPLPAISHLARQERLAREEENNRQSVAYARRLGL